MAVSRDLPPPEQMAAELAGDGLDHVPGNRLAGILDPASGAEDACRRDYGERYEPLDILGQGGQGIVLRVRDSLLNREVAIKAVRPPYDPLREKSIENEARFSGALEHPNILPTYDLGHDEAGSPFFVMKKLGGANLEDLLKKARNDADRDRAAVRQTLRGPTLPGDAGGTAADYSTRRLLSIFQQVCHAVEYAHSRGVYHLDLKPQNVALGDFGEVYVLDWGFAERKEEPTRVVAGTPIYIAPERMTGARPDARCDVYSLGVILYRILTLRPHRDIGGLTWGDFRKRWRDFPVVPPRLRDPRIPRDLEAIVLKALADDPDRRYASVHDLNHDLERFLDLLPVTAYRESVWSRTGKFVKRHRTFLSLTGVVLLAAATVGGFAWHGARVARRLAEDVAEAQARGNVIANTSREREASLDRERERRQRVRVHLEQAAELLENNRDAARATADPALRWTLMRPVIDLYTAAAQLDRDAPDPTAEPYYGLARAYALAGRPEEALRNYTKSYQVDSSYLPAHYHAGLILYDLGRLAEAAAEFANLEGGQAAEYAELGQAWLRLGRGLPTEALDFADRVERRNPHAADVWEIRARAHLTPGTAAFDPVAALRAAGRVIELGQGDADAHARRGLLFHARYRERRDPADLAAAFFDWDQALARDARSFAALLGRARARRLRAQELERDARDASREAVRARDASVGARRAALVAKDAGAAEAVSAAHRATADAEAQNAEDAEYRARKFHDDARQSLAQVRVELEAALRLRPRSAPALAERAALWEIQGDFEAAARDYAAALAAVGEGDADGQTALRERRGRFRLRRGEAERAEADFTRALERLAAFDGVPSTPEAESETTPPELRAAWEDAPDALARGEAGLHTAEGRRRAEKRLLALRGWTRLALERPVEAAEDFAAAQRDGSAGDAETALGEWLARRALGRVDGDGALRKRGDAATRDVDKALASYYLGEIAGADEVEVLRVARDADERGRVRFFLGVYALLHGDSARALADFDALRLLGGAESWEYAVAEVFRKRAEAGLAAQSARERLREVRPFMPPEKP